jgi:hypothetical protein
MKQQMFVFASLLLLSLAIVYCKKAELTPECAEKCAFVPPPDACLAAIPRYYYDQSQKKCLQYTWGGCGEFAFETLEACESCGCE